VGRFGGEGLGVARTGSDWRSGYRFRSLLAPP